MTAPPRGADKVVAISDATKRIQSWRTAGERVVVADGVFDLLRAGHVRALARARALGDRLVVAIHDDRTAHQELGAGRPLVPLSDRARVCAALRVVDLVAILAAVPLANLLHDGRPDLHARGADPDLTAARADRPSDARYASVDLSGPPGTDLVVRLRDERRSGD